MADREILLPIARADSRNNNGIDSPLPFHGVDIWNAWELTWLGPGNRPEVATASFYVPADSRNLVESKSLKLYLNTYAMTGFDDKSAVAASIADDLSSCTESTVDVFVAGLEASDQPAVSVLSGSCLDSLQVSCDTWEIDADTLVADSSVVVEESLHTHLLRSLCPVTGQPDIGSLQVGYRGPRIDAKSLLRYVISFREHADFHEACVERIFVDILEKCGPEQLSVYARYQRRGGIDINPFRSNCDQQPDNLRLWRQ